MPRQTNTAAFVDETTVISTGQDGCIKTWRITHH
jgi:hypothetical protein